MTDHWSLRGGKPGAEARTRFRWALLAIWLFPFGYNPVAPAAELSVKLLAPPSEGTVVFLLFDSANAFGGLRDPVVTRRFPFDGREVYRLPDMPPGEYALLVYHDENGNGRLDENFIGIPREPLGFSNRYRPKGPPSFSRAQFLLEEGTVPHFDVELSRPLGRRGQIGVGAGVIGRSSPYRQSNEEVLQPIPAVTYIGERFQIFGPAAQVGLISHDKFRLAAALRYRVGVYEEDDSPLLNGLGNREDTLMAGPAMLYRGPAGVQVSLRYAHDMLDRIGGGEVRLEVGKSYQVGIARISPSLAINRLGGHLSNHDFGVPADHAAPGRPGYRLNETYSFEAGLGSLVELGRHWRAVLTVAVEFLDDEVTDSPIVGKDRVFKGFAALQYAL